MWALCHGTGLSRPMQFLHANATWNVTRVICCSACRKTGWYFGHVNEFYLVARENIWTSLKSTIQMIGQTFATCLFRSLICWCDRFTWSYFICGYEEKRRYISHDSAKWLTLRKCDRGQVVSGPILQLKLKICWWLLPDRHI